MMRSPDMRLCYYLCMWPNKPYNTVNLGSGYIRYTYPANRRPTTNMLLMWNNLVHKNRLLHDTQNHMPTNSYWMYHCQYNGNSLVCLYMHYNGWNPWYCIHRYHMQRKNCPTVHNSHYRKYLSSRRYNRHNWNTRYMH